MRKSFVKVTHRGNVVKVVREHYLRDDIPCGMENCVRCAKMVSELQVVPVLLTSKSSCLLIPDTNLLLHFLDIFESSKITNVVILQTVLDEVRHHNMGLYNRIRSLVQQPAKNFFVFSNEHHKLTHVEKTPGESDNDRNDRAIRQAAIFYKDHLEGNVSVLLLTNDNGNRGLAIKSGIKALSLADYISGLNDPELMDVMERGMKEDISEDLKLKVQYPEHLSMSALHLGIKEGRFFQGCLHCSHYNTFEGTVQTSVSISPDLSTITVSGRLHMNRAVNGDTVVLELLPKEDWSKSENESMIDNENDTSIAPEEQEAAPTKQSAIAGPKAKVVGILRRSGRSYCGSIDRRTVRPNQSTQHVVFIAMDRRIPRIRIRTRQAEHLAGQRVIVTMDDWSVDSQYPNGHLVRQLGAAGDKATETEAILLEHDVAHDDFAPAVLACLPTSEWIPESNDYESRADFRDIHICSVDPPGCTDIDDALHARSVPGTDLIEVGVHIADVTHFVAGGSALDKEASARATTVYLVDRRIDMLPSLLGTNLCSLKSGVERLAFSVIWHMDSNAKVTSVRFCKSIIRSHASLTYDEAQAKLDDPHALDPVSVSLKTLNSLAQILKQKRIDAGALTLASPEVRFTIDRETMNPIDVEVKEMKAANSMVEEFMLLANIYVAKELHSKFPDNAILRRHPAPPADNFKSLNAALEGLGLPTLDVTSSRTLANSLDRINIPNDAFLNRLIRIMTTRCMQQAVYFASGTQPYDQFWHYGLACPIYTHFTSPIRRYADVLVHRLLSCAIEWPSADFALLGSKEVLEECCHNLNYRNRMAQQAQRSSVELFTHMYFKDRPIEEVGYVIRVMDSGFVVLLPEYGIEGIVWKPDNLS